MSVRIEGPITPASASWEVTLLRRRGARRPRVAARLVLEAPASVAQAAAEAALEERRSDERRAGRLGVLRR